MVTDTDILADIIAEAAETRRDIDVFTLVLERLPEFEARWLSYCDDAAQQAEKRHNGK
jgi:hypothetical protein